MAERLSKGEALDLAEQLPAPLAAWLHTTSGPEPFHYDEFLRRVAAREGTDTETAERHARAVFRALAQSVDGDELDDVAAELPQDFAPLIAEARRRFFDTVDADTFLAKVAERASISDGRGAPTSPTPSSRRSPSASPAARSTTSRPLLPLELREPLERGKAHSGGQRDADVARRRSWSASRSGSE